MARIELIRRLMPPIDRQSMIYNFYFIYKSLSYVELTAGK